jgi:hypothetical protein
LRPSILDSARSNGYEVVVVTDQQKDKLSTQVESGGLQVRTIDQYVIEFNDSFSYQFVNPQDLTLAEYHIYDYTSRLLNLVGIPRAQQPMVRISETMRLTSDDTAGVWDSTLQAIVIKRTQLRTLTNYAATLLHEAAHATSGTVDATRAFESILTKYLGQIASTAVGRIQDGF